MIGFRDQVVTIGVATLLFGGGTLLPLLEASKRSADRYHALYVLAFTSEMRRAQLGAIMSNGENAERGRAGGGSASAPPTLRSPVGADYRARLGEPGRGRSSP